jgi:RHS repeat-associated protein
VTYSTLQPAAVRRARTGYWQKHASARFAPVVHADRHQSRRFCTSGPVEYQRTTTNASDGSIDRYYDPATGQFLSVDPDVAVTGQPYAYAGADPVNESDPSGRATVGICAGGNFALGPIGLGVGDCLTRTVDRSGEDDIGIATGFIVGGFNTDENVGIYYQVSNATNLQELGKQFSFATVQVDVLGGVAVSVFWNDSVSHLIYGIDIGPSAGIGFTAGIGESYTVLDQFNGVVSANIARGVWDAFNPGAAIALDLTKARSGVAAAEANGLQPSGTAPETPSPPSGSTSC